MADHDTYEFATEGFRKGIAPDHPARERLLIGAGLLEEIVKPHLPRLALGALSARRPGKNKSGPYNQICHPAAWAADPAIPVAVFNIRPSRASVELYCTRYLSPGVWAGPDLARPLLARDSGNGASRRPVFPVLNAGEAQDEGFTVDQVIERLRIALDDIEAALGDSSLRARWTGESVARRVLKLVSDHFQPQCSPDWLHQGRSRPSFDFYDRSKGIAAEIMGGQHFTPVELWGGEEKLRESNGRMVRKTRACMENQVALVFMRWQSGMLLDRLRNGGDSAAAELAQVTRDAIARCRASGYRWIDLDECNDGLQYKGYRFLRSAGLASALDG